MSGGDVRDEEIVNCPVVSGSDPSGLGGSFGTDGAERVLGVGGSAGVFAGLGIGIVNSLARLSMWMQEIDAGVDDIDAGLLAEFVTAERASLRARCAFGRLVRRVW